MYLLYISIIVFSLAGMALVLFLKMREIETGQSGFLGRLSVAGDEKIKNTLLRFESFVGRINLENIRAAAKVAAVIFSHALDAVIVFVRELYERISHKLATKLRERPVGKNGKNGVVSFFLKNVSESSKEREGKKHKN